MRAKPRKKVVFPSKPRKRRRVTAARARLRNLIDFLPAKDVFILQDMAEVMAENKFNPLMQALLAAPEDEEPLTEEDIEAIAEGEKAIIEGRVKSLEQVEKELGL